MPAAPTRTTLAEAAEELVEAEPAAVVAEVLQNGCDVRSRDNLTTNLIYV